MPPQFNLSSANIPPVRYIYEGQETSGVLADQQFEEPVPIVSIPPELPDDYPAIPRKPIIVDLLIGVTGKVEKAIVIQSPDNQLNEIVLKHLKQWYFEPAKHKESGAIVESWKAIPIYFGL